jgi:hypothetical protein
VFSCRERSFLRVTSGPECETKHRTFGIL